MLKFHSAEYKNQNLEEKEFKEKINKKHNKNIPKLYYN